MTFYRIIVPHGYSFAAKSEHRQRPVVLDLEEDEAALLLRLLDCEEDTQVAEGDANYQNGSGYERQCAENRLAAKRAEDLADRIRKILGKHLDKAYAGELGL